MRSQSLAASFKVAIGHSPHIVRTLAHDAMAEEGEQGTEMALALCGQKTKSIAKTYEMRACRVRVKKAQEELVRVQNRLNEDAGDDDNEGGDPSWC